MDPTAIIQRTADFVLRQAPSMDDMGGLTGYDPWDGHYFRGLNFNPVGANPDRMPGFEDKLTQQAQVLQDISEKIKLLGDPDASTWEGEGAQAFVDKVKKLPGQYADAAAALRAMAPLITEARQAIKDGKAKARTVDDEAAAAKARIVHACEHFMKPKSTLDKIVSTVAPVTSIIGIALDPEVERGVKALIEAMERGIKLHFTTKAGLDHIGAKIAKLDDKAPQAEKTGFFGDFGWATDMMADAGDLFDAGMNPLAKWMIDKFPSEAHLAAGFMNDSSTVLGCIAALADGTVVGVPIGLVLGAGSIALQGGQLAIDNRLYRTGAVDSTGKPVVSRDDMAQEQWEFGLGLATMGTGKAVTALGGPAADVISSFVGPAADAADGADPHDPSTWRPRVMYVDPLEGYAEDKGWTGGDDPTPELRVHQDGNICYPPGQTGTPPNIVPIPPAKGDPNVNTDPYTGKPGGDTHLLAQPA
jgi:uncharacterized protein YukE